MKLKQIYYGWWIVAASAIGMSTGPGQFAFGSLGLFMLPLGEEFGWNRAEISLASTFFTIALALSIPLIGKLVDRYGSRLILLPSIVICAVLLALITVVVKQLWMLFLVFTLIGSLGAGANALPYLRTISAWFDRRRGLAIGIAMGGSGFGFAYVPPIVQHMIDSYGWRSGYLLLAVVTILVALPLAWFVLRETPDAEQIEQGNELKNAQLESQTQSHIKLSTLLGNKLIWQLFLIFSLLSFGLYGILAHLFPMLSDKGMASADAAMVQFTLGMAVVVSRMMVGYIIDRFFAPYVAVVCFTVTALGIGLLTMESAGPLAFVAAVLIGFSMGAEIDLLAFLTGRYFGVENFGQVYGILFMSFLIGTSLGPFAYGLVFESTGAYVLALVMSIILIIISTLFTARLPRY